MSKQLNNAVGIVLVLIAFFSLVRPSSAHSSELLEGWLIDSSGSLVLVDGSILGDTDSTAPDNDYPEKKNLERAAETRKKTLELNKQKIESKLENVDNKLMIRQEIKRDNKLQTRTERELSLEEPLHVEREEGKKLEVKAIEGERLEIKGEKVRTRTNFPLTIGQDNALIITKKDGTQRTVTYLPDQAVANLEAKGFITTSSETDLEESEDGTPVYRFEAQEEKRILGLFRRRFNKSVEVSAETGEVVSETSTESTGLARFLERFAF